MFRRFGPRSGSSFVARGLTAGVLIAATAMIALPASADDTTISYDTLRTGWDPNEAGLGPSAVSASDFGQLFSTAVDGQVYGQPLVVGGTVIATTENNNVYGMNAATGAITWSRNIGPFWPASTLGCGDLVPNIGITSSPVYDPATGAVFFVAKVNDGPDAAHPHWYMHSINPATGVERSGWPVTIQGKPTNNSGNTFNPETANQRTGLLLLGGVVYAGFASNCDYGPYVGYVAGVKTATPAMSTLWTTESGASNSEAGIWQSGGGLVSDGAGRIILTTGNGVSPAPGPGSSPPGTLGESVVRLQVNTDGSLTAKDFFSPNNNSKLDQDDTDFGSGGPMALPAGFGTTAHPHLLVQSGKDGRVFLLDRDNLGGMGQGAGGGDNSVGPPVGPYNGTWDHPAFWGGDGGYVYDVENGGYLRALKYGVNGSGLPVLSSAGTSSSTFGFTSGAPVVTSSGTTSGSAIVWVVYSSGSSGSGGQLRAYDAVPQSGQLHLRYSAAIGTATKFATPATDGNRVYIGTRDGHVIGFGRPTTSALTSSPTDFGSVAVGSTAHATVTVTASRAVTVTGVATTAPFGATPPALPVSLSTGQTLSVPVTFTPSATGGASGSLVFATDSGTVSLDLHGTGTQTGLGATPSSIAFGTVPTGAHNTVSVSITNTGTAAVTITGSTPPAAPFTAAGFPANGSTLAAGASVAVSVTYTPTVAGTQTGSLSVASSGGSVTVPLTGTAVTGAAHLSITPNPLDFGSVPLGQSVTKTFDIANTGNITLTITKAAPPVGAFNTSTPVSEGQQLSPGDDITQSITFTPTALGAVSAQYSITGDDGQGAILEKLTGTGVAASTAGPVTSGIANKCLDDNNGTANGTAVIIYDCNGGANQQWTFTSGTLQIGGKCADVKGQGTANGTKVQLYDCNGGNNQKWTAQANGELVSVASGRCLDDPGSSTVNGTQLAIWDCNAGANQQWKLPSSTVTTPKAGPIVSAVSATLCIDDAGSGTANGTAIQIATCTGAANQQWTVGAGNTLQVLGGCLDIDNAATANSSPVQLYACNGTVAQVWQPQANGSLLNPNSGRCLDDPAFSTTSGTLLSIYDCNGGANQRWTLPS